MRRYAWLSLGLGALIAAAGIGGLAVAAEGEIPVTVPLPVTELSVDAGFGPKVLSKTDQGPVSLRMNAEIAALDGSHPPALRELTVEDDHAIHFHVEGIPTCGSRLLRPEIDSRAALATCRPALIGTGEVTAQVNFAEHTPVDVTSRVLVFHGGSRNGATTLLVHAYFGNPVSAAILVPVTVSTHSNGRFGTRAIAKIPRIADGAGSITKFEVEIPRRVVVGGKTFNPLSATCPDGELRVHALGEFENGDRSETEVIRACTARR